MVIQIAVEIGGGDVVVSEGVARLEFGAASPLSEDHVVIGD